jgi:hypothetical protein
MNRFKLGLVVPITLLMAVGCNGDPTSDLRNGIDHLTAAPSQLFLEPGTTKTVEVAGVDEQGNPLDLSFVVTPASSAITVKRDSSFHPVFINDTLLTVPPTATRWRFIVTGVSYANTSFKIASEGKEIVVPVQVVPQTQIEATFDNPTPAFGDVVTLTAASGTTFADTAQLLIGGDPLRPLTITARATDGTSISFIAPPNVASPITITSVSSVGAPTLTFSPATSTVLTTTVVDSVDVTFSTAAPTIGQNVTMTIPNTLINFDTTTASVAGTPVLTFPEQLTGPAAGPANVTLSADSNSLTFDAPPNANGPAAVTAFVFPGGYVFPLPTRTGITTTPHLSDTLDITVSNGTPNVLDPITITLPGTFNFGPAEGDSVIIGGQTAIVQSATASSITVIPLPGSVGQPRVVGVFPVGFPQFSLSLQGDDSVTVPALTPLEGTGDPATAPEITIPGTLVDAGSFAATSCGQNSGAPCQLYKFTLAAGASLHFVLSAPGSADLGLYFLNAGDLSDASQVCDALGRASPPEDCTLAFAAGTYLMAVVSFGPFYAENDPNPPFISVDIQ